MNYVLMLAYNKVDIVESALNRLIILTKNKDYTFLFVDPEYPLNSSTDLMEKLYLRYQHHFKDPIYLKIKNEGVAQNYNQVRDFFKFQSHDRIICFDPDSSPQNSSFYDSMLTVLEDKSVAMCILRRGDFDDVPLTNEITINGIECFQTYRGHSWPMWAFNGDFLKNNTVTQQNKYFGFIEDDFHDRARQLGLKCVILKHEKDDMIDGENMGLGGQDAFYLQWQSESGSKTTELSFEDWINQKTKVN